MADRNAKGQFPRGVSGNPSGRPRGSRDIVVEAFLRDFTDVWRERGKAALQQVAIEDPTSFVRAAVALVPKDMNVAVTDMTYDEAVRMLLNGGRAESGDADRAPESVN